jgi:hypothetical protein
MKRTHQHPTSKRAVVILSEVEGSLVLFRLPERRPEIFASLNMTTWSWRRGVVSFFWMLEIGGLVIKT